VCCSKRCCCVTLLETSQPRAKSRCATKKKVGRGCQPIMQQLLKKIPHPMAVHCVLRTVTHIKCWAPTHSLEISAGHIAATKVSTANLSPQCTSTSARPRIYHNFSPQVRWSPKITQKYSEHDHVNAPLHLRGESPKLFGTMFENDFNSRNHHFAIASIRTLLTEVRLQGLLCTRVRDTRTRE
jgi:hypothetical protein